MQRVRDDDADACNLLCVREVVLFLSPTSIVTLLNADQTSKSQATSEGLGTDRDGKSFDVCLWSSERVEHEGRAACRLNVANNPERQRPTARARAVILFFVLDATLQPTMTSSVVVLSCRRPFRFDVAAV